MKFEFKSRFTSGVIYTQEIPDGIELHLQCKGALELAVKAGANLRDANLGRANLRGANLGGADLRDANLRDADLGGANLGRANLRGANLGGADLRDANLRDADLGGANLGGADLRDADLGLKPEDIPVIQSIDAAILAAIESGGKLEMNDWHKCETTHCRAGWAIHLGGKKGYALEKKVGSFLAGREIYLASTPDAPVPNFFASNEDAMADLKERAAKQTA